MKRRVVIADDHGVVRHGLRLIVDAQPDLQVVADLDDGARVVDAIVQHDADVLVLDLSLPNRTGHDILRDAKQRAPRCAVVIFTMYPEDQLGLSFLRHGATAYLNKRRTPDEVVVAIRMAANGRRYLTDTLAHLALEGGGAAERPPHESLTPRESEVFLRLLEGRTVSEIAAEINLGVSTVSKHVAHIKEKIGAASVGDILRYAHRVGLLGTTAPPSGD